MTSFAKGAYVTYRLVMINLYLNLSPVQQYMPLNIPSMTYSMTSLGIYSMQEWQNFPQITSQISCNNSHICEVCPLVKRKKLPFLINDLISNKIFDLVHCDIWGRFSVHSFSCYRFVLTLVGDNSRCTWFFMMQSKLKLVTISKTFIKWSLFTSIQK